MNIRPVKTAVVGCGMISRVYLRNMRERFHILDVVGCAAAHSETARARAEEFGIRAMSVDEIAADEDIELVVNLTPPAAHYELVRKFLESGKHVYTEKVMAAKFEEARELVRLADARNLYLGSAPDTFLGAAIQTARFALESGLIGEPTGVVAVVNRDNRVGAEFIPFLAQPGGGIAFDVGIYYLTAMLYLLGPLTRVCGFSATREPVRTHYQPGRENFGERYTLAGENLFSGALSFACSAGGTVQFNSECIFDPHPQLTIYGTQGILYLPDPDTFGGEVRVLRRGAREPFTLSHNHGFADNSRGVGAAELAWALRARRPPRAGKELALHAIEALCGIVHSGDSGKTWEMGTTFAPTPPLPQGHQRFTGFADFQADEEAALV